MSKKHEKQETAVKERIIAKLEKANMKRETNLLRRYDQMENQEAIRK